MYFTKILRVYIVSLGNAVAHIPFHHNIYNFIFKSNTSIWTCLQRHSYIISDLSALSVQIILTCSFINIRIILKEFFKFTILHFQGPNNDFNCAFSFMEKCQVSNSYSLGHLISQQTSCWLQIIFFKDSVLMLTNLCLSCCII